MDASEASFGTGPMIQSLQILEISFDPWGLLLFPFCSWWYLFHLTEHFRCILTALVRLLAIAIAALLCAADACLGAVLRLSLHCSAAAGCGFFCC